MTGGKLETYYGLNIARKPGEVRLSATKYLERAQAKLRVPMRKWDTPMDSEMVLPRLTEASSKVLHARYRSVVGVCMHVSVTCRPDVSCAIRELASHLQAPGVAHLSAAVRTFQYLYAARHLGLKYSVDTATARICEPVTEFFGTCDASHNVTWDSKGITGWAYHLNGAAISWHRRAQELAALSSTEAELITVNSGTVELRYLHKVLKSFGQQVHLKSTVLGQDNMSTIKLCESARFNARTRHISLRYHHCGDQQRLGVLKLRYLDTKSMVADALTKPLRKVDFHRHRAVLLLGWHVLSGRQRLRGP